MRVDSKDVSQVARLRAQRIAQGLGQADMAYIYDTTKKTIQKWESPTSTNFPSEEELDTMEEAFTGFLSGVYNVADNMLINGANARLWRSQEFYEAAGHTGSFERMNLKIVFAAMCLCYSGKVDWDDINWSFADYPSES